MTNPTVVSTTDLVADYNKAWTALEAETEVMRYTTGISRQEARDRIVRYAGIMANVAEEISRRGELARIGRQP
jgi:hypothetical protein